MDDDRSTAGSPPITFSSQGSFSDGWRAVADHLATNGILGREDSFNCLYQRELVDYEDFDQQSDDMFKFEADTIVLPSDPLNIQNIIGTMLDVDSGELKIGNDYMGPNPSSSTAPEHITDGRPVENQIILPDSTHGSMIPSNTNYPGPFVFNLSFEEQPEKTSRNTAYTYSESLDKLFINMGVSCKVCFTVEKLPPSGCVIRALPIFEKSEHVNLVVRRCPNHSMKTDASNLDHVAPEHLIRCENDLAQYDCDSRSNRLSVSVPFLPPQVGSNISEYLYKFMCLGSCAGGLNRRPLMVVYTLENEGKVLGRKALRVRICACPGRDRKSEEKQSVMGSQLARNPGVAQSFSSDFVFCGPPSKKSKGGDEEYIIKLKSKANYEILKKIAESLELADAVPSEMRERYLTPKVNNNLDDFTTLSHNSILDTRSTVPQSNVKIAKSELSSVAHVYDAQKCNLEVINVKKEKFDTISSWLENIGMTAYTEMFKDKGLIKMSQLEELGEDDFNELHIGGAHRSLIWEALSSLGTSLPSSQNSNYSCTTSSGRPTLVQVTRCRLKKVFSIPKHTDINDQ